MITRYISRNYDIITRKLSRNNDIISRNYEITIYLYGFRTPFYEVPKIKINICESVMIFIFYLYLSDTVQKFATGLFVRTEGGFTWTKDTVLGYIKTD